METLKDIVSSLSDWLKNRVVNPWFACFIASWFAINWRLVLALASDDTYVEKIKWIDTKLYPASWHLPFYGIIQPALWAVLWVLVSPICFRKLITFYRREQGKTRDEIVVLDKTRLVTRAEAEVYLMQRVRAVAALETFREQSDARESGLLERINSLESDLNGLARLQADTALNAKRDESRHDVYKFSAEELFGADLHVIKILADRGMEKDEAILLIEMAGRGKSTVETLVKLYADSDTSVTVVLTRLEKLGLIDMQGSELRLTKSGYVVLDRLRKHVPAKMKQPI